MRSIKIKVGVHIERRVFEETLATLGPDVDLRVDANGAWTEAGALKNIDLLKAYAVQAVEQPVAKNDLDGFKTVTQYADMVVIADESVCSLEDAEKLMSRQACDAFNIRLSKCGGFFASLAVAELAMRGRLRCQVGCQVGETGILSAAGRHLAGWLEDVLYLEGSFGRWVLQEDIVEEDIRFGSNGRARPLEGPGLGVRVCREKLDKYAILTKTVQL
jgi:muconate cycloisomerase